MTRKTSDGYVATDDGVGISLGDEWLKLGEIARGEVDKKFPEALKEAVANICSFRFPAKGKREVIIRLVLNPSEDRSEVTTEVFVETKLAKPRPKQTKLYLSPAGNEIVVSEDDPMQPNLEFK